MNTTNRAKRLCGLLLCAVLMLALSSCSFSFLNTEKLMTPPRATGNRAGVQSLLAADAGSYTLVYPSGGDYRTAIIMRDFTGDGASDALCFCTREDKTGTVAYFMEAVGSDWEIVGKAENAATGVYKVLFGDLDGDEVEEIVICWGSAQSLTSSLSVYDYVGGQLKEYTLSRYFGEALITDLNDDRSEELFIAGLYNRLEDGTEQDALGYLYGLGSLGLEIRSSVELDNTVTRYTQVLFGKGVNSEYMVFLDGLRADSSTVTQVVFRNASADRLEAPFSTKASQSLNVTRRPAAAAYSCRDVDLDGRIEIPTVTQLAAVEDSAATSCSYQVKWNTYNTSTGTMDVVSSMVINSVDGYALQFADSWRDSITVRYDAATKTLTLYELEFGAENALPKLGEALVKLRVFTAAEWESSKTTEGYTRIAQQNEQVYAVSVLAHTDAVYFSAAGVQQRFSFWS